MTKVELGVIEDFLEAPWGTPEMSEALAELIEMAAVTRRGWDAKDRQRIARREARI